MVRTFSVTRKKVPSVNFTQKERRLVQYFSESILEHFSMSEELAKAIGTVVVQALTENAKDEESSDSFDDFGDDEFGDEFEDDSFGDLPEADLSSGDAEEAEGAKEAEDLSSDFAELKKTVNNHSVHTFAEDRYNKIKDFLSLTPGRV